MSGNDMNELYHICLIIVAKIERILNLFKYISIAKNLALPLAKRSFIWQMTSGQIIVMTDNILPFQRQVKLHKWN